MPTPISIEQMGFREVMQRQVRGSQEAAREVFANNEIPASYVELLGSQYIVNGERVWQRLPSGLTELSPDTAAAIIRVAGTQGNSQTVRFPYLSKYTVDTNTLHIIPLNSIEYYAMEEVRHLIKKCHVKLKRWDRYLRRREEGENTWDTHHMRISGRNIELVPKERYLEFLEIAPTIRHSFNEEVSF